MDELDHAELHGQRLHQRLAERRRDDGGWIDLALWKRHHRRHLLAEQRQVDRHGEERSRDREVRSRGPRKLRVGHLQRPDHRRHRHGLPVPNDALNRAESHSDTHKIDFSGVFRTGMRRAPTPRMIDARTGMPQLHGMREATRNRNFHVPLPEDLYRRLRKEAARLGLPATELAREAIRAALKQRQRDALREAITRYARESAGTRDDLDANLESAAIEHLLARSRR